MSNSFNPLAKIVAIEFSFDKLDPDLATPLAKFLARNIDYPAIANAHWLHSTFEGIPTLRAEHEDAPFYADFESLGEILDDIRDDAERVISTYNNTTAVNVEFDGVGVHFAEEKF